MPTAKITDGTVPTVDVGPGMVEIIEQKAESAGLGDDCVSFCHRLSDDIRLSYPLG